MTDYTVYNQVFSAFAFIGFFLCCVCLPWQVQVRNPGACLYLIWVAIGCFNQFVNSIVWAGNVINWAPVWCDISSHIIIGISSAIPACGLCITHRMWRSLTAPSSYMEEKARRQALWTDLAVGLGLPVLLMVLYYIPQGNRFNILEDIGCLSATFLTPVAVVLVLLPPVLISLTSCVYSVLAVRSLLKLRKSLNGQSSELVDAKYIRLIALGCVDACFSTPFTLTFLIMDVRSGVYPWVSWADTHYNFSYVGQYPGVIWRGDSSGVALTELSRWLNVFSALVFFALFGLTREARANYKSMFLDVSNRCTSIFHSRKREPRSDNLADTLRIVDAVGQKGPLVTTNEAPWPLQSKSHC